VTSESLQFRWRADAFVVAIGCGSSFVRSRDSFSTWQAHFDYSGCWRPWFGLSKKMLALSSCDSPWRVLGVAVQRGVFGHSPFLRLQGRKICAMMVLGSGHLLCGSLPCTWQPGEKTRSVQDDGTRKPHGVGSVWGGGRSVVSLAAILF
jgi:hypothetical protein